LKRILRLMAFIGVLMVCFVGNAWANRIFTVKLTWKSGNEVVDLDLSVTNPMGEKVFYGNPHSNWGAEHVRDETGSQYSSSYEEFNVDLDQMDCFSSGRYQFDISHYGGPSVTSTITAEQNGQVVGSWEVTTEADDTKYGVHYDADKTRCSGVKFPRMSSSVKHLSIHVYTKELGCDDSCRQISLSKLKSNIRKVANNIRQHALGDMSAKTAYTGEKGSAQLAVQVSFTPYQFIHIFDENIEKAVNYLETIIETFGEEGFSVHLLISAHGDLKVDKWKNINWSLEKNRWWSEYDKDAPYLPYQPCFKAVFGERHCPYDVIFNNVHKPIITELVKRGLTQKLAVIYVLNEFDYSKDPKNNKIGLWNEGVCGAVDWESCRKAALVLTAERGVLIANQAANGTVPIGIKFAHLGADIWDDKGNVKKRGEYSAWTQMNYQGKEIDLLEYFVKKLAANNGLFGYDCYWGPDSYLSMNAYWKTDNTCMEDKERLMSILLKIDELDYFKNGRIEIAEYGRHCQGSPDNFKTKSGRTSVHDMTTLVSNWPEASSFNLFAYTASGEVSGCYALADSKHFEIFESAKPTLKGIKEQIKLITGCSSLADCRR